MTCEILSSTGPLKLILEGRKSLNDLSSAYSARQFTNNAKIQYRVEALEETAHSVTGLSEGTSGAPVAVEVYLKVFDLSANSNLVARGMSLCTYTQKNFGTID